MPDQRTILIVGANRGLGLGLAREMLGRGWRVIATTRKPDAGGPLAELATQSGGKLTVRTLDLDDTGSYRGFADRLRDEVLDVLFLNAGVSGPAHRSADQATPEEIGALMFTNAVAPVRVARLLADRVPEGTGTIAFMSSILGSVEGNTNGAHELYRASKAALNSLTRGLYATLAKRKLTVLSLHPGWVRTDMGGSNADIDIETSVRGIADVIEAEQGTQRHSFLDYRGQTLPW
jgi:NAD(P)-dependent dehydrogenase (short-subunit alcohol dehydrogenase family)